MPKRKRKGRKGKGGESGWSQNVQGPTTTAHNPDVGFDYARPRKPEEDIVDYFSQIHANLTPGEGAQGGQEGRMDEEEEGIMVENALDELSNHEASLATHKKGSRALEALIRCARPS